MGSDRYCRRLSFFDEIPPYPSIVGLVQPLVFHVNLRELNVHDVVWLGKP